MKQIISLGTSTDGYEYFVSFEEDSKSTGVSEYFRKNLKTGIIEGVGHPPMMIMSMERENWRNFD